MNHIEIPIQNTFYNSPIVNAYLQKSDVLTPFYPNGFELEGILQSTKSKVFDSDKRMCLVEVLKDQYIQSNIDIKNTTVGKNIESLLLKNTYTITAGQQIHAYLGPMFVAYKLLSAVALASACQTLDPDNNYVPVFWMATEDHDFEEISSIDLFGETFTWQKPVNTNAAVGSLSTAGLDLLGEQIKAKFKNDPETETVIQKMQNIYNEIPNFAAATRKIIHHFFESTGIVVLDANEARLKSIFSPVLAKEIAHPQPELIDQYSDYLESHDFKKQINPRESNLFLFHKGNRERLTLNGDHYLTADTKTQFSKVELQDLLTSNPEFFSPNVALRPLYQEFILPNLAYISGGSEMVYWYQIKGLFEHYQIDYPNVWLRKSGLIVPSKIAEYIAKAELTVEEMFLDSDDLTTIIANLLNAGNSELFNQVSIIQDHIHLLESAYRTSKLFNKSTLDLIKTLKHDVNRLQKEMEEEQINLLEEAPIFSKIIKIKDNYFKTKQERDLPLFTQFKHIDIFNSPILYNNYIKNTNLLVCLA